MNPSMLGKNLLIETKIPSTDAPYYSEPKNIQLYTKHSYQVVGEGAISGYVAIQASNGKEGQNNFSTMVKVLIDSGKHINVTPGEEAGFVYNGDWNMVRTRIMTSGIGGGGINGTLEIYENHNIY
jgi:hypothetical protein